MLIGVTRTDGHDIELHLAQHLAVIGESLRHLQAFARIGQAVDVGIGHGLDFGVWQL